MRLIATLALCLVLAGCADVVDGTALPAEKPTSTTPTTTTPTLVPTASLSTLLLKRAEIADIVGDTDMQEVQQITSAIPDMGGRVDPVDCSSVMLPARTGLSDKAVQGVLGNVNRGAHQQAVTQVVAIFDNRNDPAETIGYVRAQWTMCHEGQQFSVQSWDGKVDSHWTAGPNISGQNRTGSSMTRQEAPPRTCEHVIAAQANVIAETMVCGDGDVAAQANTVADRILAKVPR